MNRTAALAALDHPDEWDEAARVLAAEGTRADVPALLRAYDQPVDRSRVCLIDAMEALGAAEAARDWATDAIPERRWMATRLMHLLRDPSHLDVLARLVCDPEAQVAASARRALRTQPRSEQWRAVARDLAGNQDAALARDARAWLVEGD